MGKKELEFKAVMSRDEVRGYLQDLLAGLNEGTICIQTGGEYIVLNPADLIKVEVEAKRKKDKSKFSLELSWSGEERPKGEAPALKISAVAPQPTEPEEDEEPEEVGESGEDKSGE